MRSPIRRIGARGSAVRTRTPATATAGMPFAMPLMHFYELYYHSGERCMCAALKTQHLTDFRPFSVAFLHVHRIQTTGQGSAKCLTVIIP